MRQTKQDGETRCDKKDRCDQERLKKKKKAQKDNMETQ